MKDKIQMILFVLVVGAILTTALVTVDAITEPFIQKNKTKKLYGSILKAADISYEPDKLEAVFEQEIEEKTIGDKRHYVTTEGVTIVEFEGSGLWGPIYGAIALLDDLDTIKGITIIHQEETPGLGGRIGDAEFLDTFKNKKIFPALKITQQGRASGINEVDGMTGATLSCNAFNLVLNSEIQKYIPDIIKENK